MKVCIVGGSALTRDSASPRVFSERFEPQMLLVRMNRLPVDLTEPPITVRVDLIDRGPYPSSPPPIELRTLGSLFPGACSGEVHQ